MTERIKGSEMTQSEMLRELRQDIRGLHNKIDANNDANHTAHAELHKEMSKVSERTGINSTKLGFFLVFIPILVSGLVGFSFRVMA